ncbi:MAG: hypothetical protein U1E05_01790 [Patescibacteria group bacterium]|nr:hypothetical protein [Patescibacteria group bacterium]
MAFLMIEFGVVGDEKRLLRKLSSMECFRILGDWHEYRLRNAIAAGLSPFSAPVKSVIDDRDRHGASFHVSIMLENTTEVTGQLRMTGLLVSDKATTPETLQNDGNVEQVVACLKAWARVKSVEVG